MTSLGFSIQRKTHSTSLTCAASRNFRPPYFDEWDVPPCELYRKLVAMVPRTEHRLPLQIDGRLGLFPLALLLSSMRIAAGRDRGFELVSSTETGEQARIASSVCRGGCKHRLVASTD